MENDFNKKLEEAIETGDFDQIKCNNDEERSLFEAGKKIYQAKFKAIPAAEGFKQRLFNQIKQARQGEREKMENVTAKGWQVGLFSFLTRKKWAVGIASFLLIAIVASLLYWLPGTKEKASGILIPRAQADEMFTFKATKMDSTGITEESDFSLVSQIDLKLGDVEKNLMVEPKFKYEIKEISAREFLIDSLEKLNPKQIYKFTLQTTTQDANILESKDFNWAYQVKNDFQIENTLPRNRSNDVPLESGIEVTFSHENFEQWENYFSIEPVVNGRFEKHWRTIVFVPEKLQPRTVYTVTIKAGLPLSDTDLKLKNDYVFRFETKTDGNNPDEKDNFNFSDELTQFQTDQRLILPLTKISYSDSSEKNPDLKLPIKIFQFADQQQLIDYLQIRASYPTWTWYGHGENTYNAEGLKKLGDFSVPVFDQSYNNFVNFIELPIKLENGFYLVQGEMNGYVRQVAVEITDLSVYTTVNKDKTLIWVWDIKNGSQANGAEVKIEEKKTLGQTDQNGVLEVDTPDFLQKIYEEPKQFYLTVTKDGQTMVEPVGARYTWMYSNDQQVADDYWRYIFFDRTTYKPNDKIRFWGTLSPRSQDIPSLQNLTVSLEKWDYMTEATVFTTQDVKVENNYLSGEMELKNVPVGYTNLVFRVGEREIERKMINIQDYIKPAYEISVSADKKAVLTGEEVNMKAKASFFEGTPVPNLGLYYRGMQDVSGEATTNEQGQANWNMKMLPSSFQSECTPDSWSCGAENDVISVGPTTQLEEGEIIGTTSVMIFPSELMFKENQLEDSNDNNQTMSVKLLKLDFEKMNTDQEWNYDYYQPDYPSEAVADYPISVKVKEEWWEKKEIGEEYDFISKQTIKKYDYEHQEKIFWEGEAKTDEQGNYEFKIDQPVERHMYSLIVGVKDQADRYYKDDFYFSAKDYYTSDFQQHLDMYKLENNNTEDHKYKLGEKVSVEMVKYNDEKLTEQPDKRFLFIHYQNGLQDYSLSNSPKHEFDFSEQQIPNVYVEGLYFDGTRVNTSVSPLNIDNFQYDYTESELNLDIKTDKEIYEPGDKAKLRLEVKDKNGKPVETKGNLSLVDEAYFNLFDNSVDVGAILYDKVNEGNLARSSSHESYFKVYYQGGGCFTGDTKILLADGTTKTMTDIAVGDQIATLATTDSKELVTDRVVGKVKHLVGGYLLINKQMKVTPVHRILINGQWLTAGEARIGDQLLDQTGNKVLIKSIEKIYEPVVVYNLTTEKTHTYIADGFYVHNGKGDTRDAFEDTAYFAQWQSDKNGQAKIEFELPDNLTGWRVIAQSIDQKEQFGKKIEKLIVKLPIRGEIVTNSTYLTGDKPVINMRVYGDGLKGNEDIEALITSKSLHINEKKSVKPFTDFEIVLDNLPAGEHDLVLTVSTGDLKDSIKKTFTVQDSYLAKKQSRYFDLTQDTQIPVEEKSNRSQIKVMNKDVGRFYQILNSVYWQNGERIDQLAAAKSAGKLLQDYWQESYPPVEFDSTPYQRDDGGISLLPYSDSDLELSTLITMSSAKENFNQDLLKKYFMNIANNKETNTNNLVKALCGLAGLGEPVLNQVNTLNANKDLSTVDHLYLAVAMEEMGAKELAKSILQKILDNNLKNEADESFVVTGGEQDNLEATKLAAIVAIATGQKDREQMLNFLEQKATAEQPMWLIMTAYIESAKKQNIATASKVEVSWNGNNKRVEIKGYETAGFNLTREEMTSLNIKLVEGGAAAVIIDETPANPGDFPANDYLGIEREYWVDGKKVDTVKAGEVVEVRLYPQISSKDGSYLIRDILPSGLKPLTRTYNYHFGQDNRSCQYFYPISITGQKVDLLIWNGWMSSFCDKNYLNYEARVVNQGEFVIEPAQIQANDDLNQMSLGKNVGVLKIE